MEQNNEGALMGQEAPMGQEAQAPPMSQGDLDLENTQGRRDTASVIDENMAQDASPEKKQQVKQMQNMLTDMVYHPETKATVQDMLKSAPPQQSIPGAVNTVFQKFEDMVAQKQGKPMPLDMKLAGGIALFAEIMEIAEAMDVIPEDMSEEEMQPYLRETMEQYIKKGLKTKSIDPIELQQQIEPLLTDDEMAVGLAMGQQQGTPGQLQQAQAQEGMYQQRSQPDKLKAAGLQKSNQQMQQALQGIASKPPEEGK